MKYFYCFLNQQPDYKINLFFVLLHDKIAGGKIAAPARPVQVGLTQISSEIKTWVNLCNLRRIGLSETQNAIKT